MNQVSGLQPRHYTSVSVESAQYSTFQMKVRPENNGDHLSINNLCKTHKRNKKALQDLSGNKNCNAVP